MVFFDFIKGGNESLIERLRERLEAATPHASYTLEGSSTRGLVTLTRWGTNQYHYIFSEELFVRPELAAALDKAIDVYLAIDAAQRAKQAR